MGNKSIFEVETAFDGCANKCPDFEIDIKAMKSIGGYYVFRTLSCKHCERCDLISKAFKEEAK